MSSVIVDLKMIIHCLLLLLALFINFHGNHAASCEVFPPRNADENEIGFIFVPGAQIGGEFYEPLSRRIQEMFPGNMWFGLTKGWLGSFPNPLEIDGAIKDCFKKSEEAGFATSQVFQGGHSLGGVILENWVKENPELSAGIMLYGSYLADGFYGNGDTNMFPVPVLTAVGSLDAGALSYVPREARESNEPGLEGRFPVLVIDRVNHAQVASGEMPEVVIENDIDPEVDNEEAFNRYAKASVAFMVTSIPDNFDPAIVEEHLSVLAELQAFTDSFLAPFQAMRLVETSEDGKFSKWITEAQKLITGFGEDVVANLEVTNELVEFSDIGPVKPSIEGSDCKAQVKTYGHNSYPADPLDFGGLLSADVIKAKLKLEDVVADHLCQETSSRRQCADINEAAFNLALAASSEEAKTRFLAKGRQLTFGEDYVSPWGPGWEYSFGLDFNTINSTLTEVVSTSLISEPDFIIGSAAGMHYCDLLSPYRALEWIYIKGVQHGKK